MDQRLQTNNAEQLLRGKLFMLQKSLDLSTMPGMPQDVIECCSESIENHGDRGALYALLRKLPPDRQLLIRMQYADIFALLDEASP